MRGLVGKEIKCPVCGKLFIVAVKNIYKIRTEDGTEDYCSYTCYRKKQKEREEKKQ